jgi:hypothetical protein
MRSWPIDRARHPTGGGPQEAQKKMKVIGCSADGADVNFQIARDFACQVPDSLWFADRLRPLLGTVNAMNEDLCVGAWHRNASPKLG